MSSKKKKKILITGAQGDVAQSICKTIRQTYNSNVLIEGLDIIKSGPSDFIFDKIYLSPKTSTSYYITMIKKIEKNYDLIIPTTEIEIKIFSENEKIFKHALVLINNKKIINIFLSKISTHVFLKSNKIYPPKFSIPLNLIKKYKEPFFLKTIYGHGNKKYQLIDSKSKFSKLKILKKKDWMAQEYFGEKYDEYTCCVIKLKDFISTIILKRKLKGGITYFAEKIKNNKLEESLKKIAKITNLNGSINVQLKIYKNKISIFEINPRLSSTVMMRHMLGFKDCIWWIEFLLNKKIPRKFKIKDNKIYKILEEKFVH